MAGVLGSRYAVDVPVMGDAFQRSLPHPSRERKRRRPSTSRSKVLADHAVDEIRFRADPWKQNGTATPPEYDRGGAAKRGVLRQVHWGFLHQALS
jgi:hypothetical protein